MGTWRTYPFLFFREQHQSDFLKLGENKINKSEYHFRDWESIITSKLSVCRLAKKIFLLLLFVDYSELKSGVKVFSDFKLNAKQGERLCLIILLACSLNHVSSCDLGTCTWQYSQLPSNSWIQVTILNLLPFQVCWFSSMCISIQTLAAFISLAEVGEQWALWWLHWQSEDGKSMVKWQ